MIQFPLYSHEVVPCWCELIMFSFPYTVQRKEELEKEIQSLKKELHALKKAIDSDAAVKAAVEKLVNDTHRPATNNTVQTTANSTHTATSNAHAIHNESKSMKMDTLKNAVIAPVSETHQQKLHNSDPNPHGDQKLYKEKDSSREAAERDSVDGTMNFGNGDVLAAIARDTDVAHNDHEVENQGIRLPQHPQVDSDYTNVNGESLKTSTKHKQSRKQLNKPSLVSDAHSVDNHGQQMMTFRKRGEYRLLTN